MKSVALVVAALALIVVAHGAVAPTDAAVEEPKVEYVMAELASEADSITEDGSNDESAAQDATDAESADAQPIHEHFRQFTTPMPLLPNDHTTLVELDSSSETETESESGASASAGADEDGDAAGGSNPTYILPVDPFNYFPFFNGFSNVNPFSQFYPPPPYLYPQYTNYMHQYAAHGAGHPPGYPYPGSYGGVAGASPYLYGRGAHPGFPYNSPAPHPHMHYPFGAYKMDVSGPDVRTGTNNPPPFPQFSELSSEAHLIKPEIIPKSALEAELAEEDGEEEGDTVIAALIETGTDEADESDSEDEAEDLEYEAEGDESEEAEDVEIMSEEEEAEESGDAEAEDVEYLAEGADSEEAEDVEYLNDESEQDTADDVEYVNHL